MRSLFRIGTSMLLLAFLLVGLCFEALRAHGANGANGASGVADPGSRLIATERRPLAGKVEAVEVSGPINLTLRQGPAALLEVRGEQRLLANIDTSVDAKADGAVLHIGPRGILLRHRQPIEVLLTLPELGSLRITGSGDNTASGFAGAHIALTLDGSGSLQFNGRYQDIVAALHGSGDLDLTGGSSERVQAEAIGSGTLTLVGSSRVLQAELHGSGDLDARHLQADAVNLALYGSGSATVYARKHVQVNLYGSGDAAVYGDPGERSVSRTGSGSVDFSE